LKTKTAKAKAERNKEQKVATKAKAAAGATVKEKKAKAAAPAAPPAAADANGTKKPRRHGLLQQMQITRYKNLNMVPITIEEMKALIRGRATSLRNDPAWAGIPPLLRRKEAAARAAKGEDYVSLVADQAAFELVQMAGAVARAIYHETSRQRSHDGSFRHDARHYRIAGAVVGSKILGRPFDELPGQFYSAAQLAERALARRESSRRASKKQKVAAA
jgi:hypothetical protein